MLSDLQNSQPSSDEREWRARFSVEIETRSDENNTLIERVYTFCYSPQFDEWNFHEFEERKTSDEGAVTSRNWNETRHILWDDPGQASVEVPPEVFDRLAEITDSDRITVVCPTGGISDVSEETVHVVE